MSEQRKVRTDFNESTGKTIVTNHQVDIPQDRWDAIFGKKETKKEETNVESNPETPVQQAK